MLENRFQVNLSIDGEDWGIWDSQSGGEVEAELSSYQPGGANVDPIVEQNKKKPPSEITLSRHYDIDRDHARIDELEAKVGVGYCVISKQPLDGDDNPLGKPKTNTGRLMSMSPPDYDSESEDTAKIEITIQPIK